MTDSKKELAQKLRMVGQHLEWIMGALMNQKNGLWKKLADENATLLEVIKALEEESASEEKKAD